MNQLRHTLHHALPWVGAKGLVILDGLLDRSGRIGSADLFARRLGLRSRHQLARALAGESLPQIEELAAWVRTLAWLCRWEDAHLSLCRQAVDALEEPATDYRIVQRVTGLRWGEVRACGLGFMVLRFVQRCTPIDSGQRAAKGA